MSTSKERPTWPNQIKSVRELNIGDVVVKDTTLKFSPEVVAITYIEKETFSWYRRSYICEYVEFFDYDFYNDYGLLPYDTGYWNATNFLRYPTHQEFNTFQLEKAGITSRIN